MPSYANKMRNFILVILKLQTTTIPPPLDLYSHLKLPRTITKKRWASQNKYVMKRAGFSHSYSGFV